MTDAPKPDDVTALVDRLRAPLAAYYKRGAALPSPKAVHALLASAADALERLVADNARLTRERDEARDGPSEHATKDAISRAIQMLEVAERYITENGLEEYAIFYDASDCDGGAVVDDCRGAREALAAARAENDRLRAILSDAAALYGRPGGPWNIPSDPGGWLDRARAALEQGGGDER